MHVLVGSHGVAALGTGAPMPQMDSQATVSSRWGIGEEDPGAPSCSPAPEPKAGDSLGTSPSKAHELQAWPSYCKTPRLSTNTRRIVLSF